ncbi:DUF817 domain-containing protein [Alkalihalobacillus hwajinpoensis]|uniref:DUF817 domain-containing protein n=1 Tax=Guptibacillus hwajinpoensis TaxID=208199 RepID=UPI0018843CA1|nr:DUF817 domain-containing protein [Pseudalkalibacillus hwajinpoensis]MBF0708935.1 DUF817 domain-containing protein [Pseudalkalibacillus hwajinpoensis]
MKHIYNLFYFGYLQAISCLFPLIIFVTLALSERMTPFFLPRYDFILIVCILAQIFLLITKFETFDEMKVILVFHIIGLALEIYKVHMGSWSYPEEAIFKIAGVPLYSGFMYASVASYMCQAWRRLNLQLVNWPTSWMTIGLGIAIYGNFFTHHFLYDFRWVLKILVVVLFFRTMVYFTVHQTIYRMSLPISFVLIGFFIWIAENIATFFGAWAYPNQQSDWEIVHIGKISSWLLLVIVSFMIVAQLKHTKYEKLAHNKNAAL